MTRSAEDVRGLRVPPPHSPSGWRPQRLIASSFRIPRSSRVPARSTPSGLVSEVAITSTFDPTWSEQVEPASVRDAEVAGSSPAVPRMISAELEPTDAPNVARGSRSTYAPAGAGAEDILRQGVIS